MHLVCAPLLRYGCLLLLLLSSHLSPLPSRGSLEVSQPSQRVQLTSSSLSLSPRPRLPFFPPFRLRLSSPLSCPWPDARRLPLPPFFSVRSICAATPASHAASSSSPPMARGYTSALQSSGSSLSEVAAESVSRRTPGPGPGVDLRRSRWAPEVEAEASGARPRGSSKVRAKCPLSITRALLLGPGGGEGDGELSEEPDDADPRRGRRRFGRWSGERATGESGSEGADEDWEVSVSERSE